MYTKHADEYQNRSTYMNAVEVAAQSAKVTANRANIIVAMQLD